MCGISGYIGSSQISKNRIFSTLKEMRHRGPDNSDYIEKKFGNTKVFLLHTRLSILDLEKRSNQPFQIGNLCMIFNGEIYNYLELRNQLVKKGHKFTTQSDTEVLLKSYMEYGEKCVEKFIGMWAFAIIDETKKTIFLSRDIFGEKPLFFYSGNNEFIFGSEIKFIQELSQKKFQINYNKINNFLTLGYRSINYDSETYFKDIFCIEPGTNLTLDLNLKIKKKKYFNVRHNPNNKLKYNDILESVLSLITKSLALRLRSDVPLAFCLSGGVDSGFLASLAKKKLNKNNLKTFSIIDPSKDYNESKNIKNIVDDLKCENFQIEISKKNNFLNRLENLICYHDCPIATISYYIHSFLSEEISKRGFKVALSGNGGDEIFTGYYSHYQKYFASIPKNQKYNKELANWEKFVKPSIRNPILREHDYFLKNPLSRVFAQGFGENIKEVILKKNEYLDEFYFCNDPLRNSMLNEMFFEVIPIILHHDDLNSMFYSVENRTPFLDKDLFEFMLTVPTVNLIGDGFQKKILRDVSKNYLVDDVRLSRQKYGFNASLDSLISRDELLDAISLQSDYVSELFDLKKLKMLIAKKEFTLDGDINKLFFSIISVNLFLKSI